MFDNFPKKYVVQMGAHPIINGVAAVISVLAGSLASFFTGSIRASLALPESAEKGSKFAIENWHFTGEAGAFWCFVLLAALLFAWSKYSDGATDNEHKDFVSKALQGLESMPPAAFLHILAKEYGVSHEEFAKIRAEHSLLTKEKIDEAIRKVLISLARVVQAYDGNVKRQYRISLMLFSPDNWNIDKLSRVVDAQILNKASQIGSIESFAGLTIRYATDSNDEQIIESFEEFAFPIHKVRAEKEDEDNLLPGPPKAYMSGKMYECHSVEELFSELKHVFRDKNQATKMQEFFEKGPGRGVKSFVSFAVPNNKWVSTMALAGKDTAGVVHIEATDINVMKSASGFFWPVVQPFLLTISDLLSLRGATSI